MCLNLGRTELGALTEDGKTLGTGLPQWWPRYDQLIMHCKKSWRSSSTPGSGDAGPKHTGVEQSFWHPWRKFYYKYRIFPTFFTSVEIVRQSRKVSKAARVARTYNLQDYNLPLYHCATLSYWVEVAKSHYTLSGLTTPCRGSCKCEHLHSVIQRQRLINERQEKTIKKSLGVGLKKKKKKLRCRFFYRVLLSGSNEMSM